jgi:hypothetical protein
MIARINRSPAEEFPSEPMRESFTSPPDRASSTPPPPLVKKKKKRNTTKGKYPHPLQRHRGTDTTCFSTLTACRCPGSGSGQFSA